MQKKDLQPQYLFVEKVKTLIILLSKTKKTPIYLLKTHSILKYKYV